MCACKRRWLARLWNAVVVPRVEEAIISRVTASRSAISPSSPPPSQRPSPSNCGLSAGQQAVVKAALSILVNKAVLLGCPLPRHGACGRLVHFSVNIDLLKNRIKKITEENILTCICFLIPQKSTDTCWSSGAAHSLCQPSDPTKEVAVGEGGGDGTVAS